MLPMIMPKMPFFMLDLGLTHTCQNERHECVCHGTRRASNAGYYRWAHVTTVRSPVVFPHASVL